MSLADARQVAQYILNKRKLVGDALTPMQLIKLTYIAQGYMLGQYGRPLFKDPVEAWQYGPVVRGVYDAVKEYRSQPVNTVCALDYHFGPDELAVMDFVANNYGAIDAITLSNATHQIGTPWQRTWQANGRSSYISNDLIEHFYRDILAQPSHSAL